MIDRQMSPTVSPGLKAVLCCCTRREDAGGGCSSGSGLNPQQQSHLSIRNNPGVTGGGAGMGVTAQTAAGTGPLLVHSTENSKSRSPQLCPASASQRLQHQPVLGAEMGNQSAGWTAELSQVRRHFGSSSSPEAKMSCFPTNSLANKGGSECAVFCGKQPSLEGQRGLMGDLAAAN